MSETAQATEELNLQNESDFQDLSNSSLSYLELMDEFKTAHGLERIDYFYLYKYDDPDNDRKRKFIDKYDPDYPPDDHEIGLKHGGGTYLVRLVIKKCRQFKNGTQRIYKLFIHERYDELKKQKEKAEKFDRGIEEKGVFPPAPTPPAVQQPSATDFLTIAEKIMAIATPLLAPLFAQRNNGNDNAMMMEMVKQSFSSMAETMRNAMMENFKMITDMQKTNLKNAEAAFREQTRPAKDEDNGILDKIIPMISQWLPKLTGNDVQAKFLQNIVKQSKELEALKNNTDQLNKLIQYILDSEGQEATCQLLDALGIQYDFYQPEVDTSTGFDDHLEDEFEGNPEAVPIETPPDPEGDPEIDPGTFPADPEGDPPQPMKPAAKKTVKKTAVKKTVRAKRNEQKQ